MGLKVIYVVKGGPVINDATMEDVEISSMDQLMDEVITTGVMQLDYRKRESPQNF